MPRGPGALYRDVVMAASDYLLTRQVARDVMVVPSLKEVYYELEDGSCLVVKVVERHAPLSPLLLRRYARMLLKHARDTCRGFAHLLLVAAARLTVGAAAQAARMRWLRILSKYSLGERLSALLRTILREIAWSVKRRKIRAGKKDDKNPVKLSSNMDNKKIRLRAGDTRPPDVITHRRVWHA